MPAQSRLTILVVDDERSLVALFSYCLRRAGYEIKQAFDGEEAQSVFLEARESIALVVSDIHMPRASGITLAEFVLAHGCPVLLISGGAIPPDVDENGFELLTKPVLPDELVSAVDNILKRKDAERKGRSRPFNPRTLSA